MEEPAAEGGRVWYVPQHRAAPAARLRPWQEGGDGRPSSSPDAAAAASGWANPVWRVWGRRARCVREVKPWSPTRWRSIGAAMLERWGMAGAGRSRG